MGWVKQLPDGRWRAFESEGSGAERLQANAIRRTRREAVAAARDIIAEKRRLAGTLEPHKLTLAGYLKHWISHRATKSRSDKSHDRYESVCNQVPKSLGSKRLLDVKPLALQRYIDGFDGKEERATTRKRYNVLHAAFEQAVAWRLIPENPMASVTAPPVDHHEMAALDEKELVKLLRGINGRYEVPSLVDGTTGLRRGELLALGWSYIDLDEATMRIWRTVDEKPGAPPRIREYLKTHHSRRTIALMPATVAALREHKKAQAAERLAAKVWHDHGLVFPDRKGEIWRPSTFSVGWGRLEAVKAKRKELDKQLRFHDLRHTHATQLLRAGVKVDAVSKRLGHASPVITMTVYAHVLEDEDAAAVERLEAGLGAALAEKT